MMHMEMSHSSSDQENKMKIIMGYEDHHEHDSFSSDASSVVSSDDESSDDTFEEINSSSNVNGVHSMPDEHALGDMSDRLQQLPSKKGLSKHFHGKSQSFTSLSKVICLEDLAKPENPYNKKMKSCKSYVGLSRMLPPPTRSASSSKLFTKKMASTASCSSLNNNRPPAGATNNQTPLFV